MGKNDRHLVLGAKGFLGEKLYDFLKEKGHTVVGYFGKDLDQPYNLGTLVSGHDYVWNMAADMGGVGYFSTNQYAPTVNNYLIDLNVLRACEKKKVKRLFYPASACAYPTYQMNKGRPLIEEMLESLAMPDQMYGWEKLSMIKLMRHAPLDVRVGVLHTIYGEGQAYEGEKAKFPPQMAWKAIQALNTDTIEVWGDGEQTRTFLHVDDAIEKMYKVMMSDEYHGEVNIGSDKEVSINDVVAICCQILKIHPTIFNNLEKPTGVKRRLCSNEKFNKHYGEAPELDLKEGFERIINYIRSKEKL